MCARVLHLAPHPDDESIGAAATLISLREHGHAVVNLACSLGRPGQRSRRRGELEDACRRAGFELVVIEPPVELSRHDELDAAQRRVARVTRELMEREPFDLIVSPSPHDRHPAHEAVGRAARDAVRGTGVRWWLWALWGELPLPTLYSPFGEPHLAKVLDALGAHAGELARNDYAALLRSRALAGRVLGAERVFGWGAPGRPDPYAELLTEVVDGPRGFTSGPPRVVDAADPLPVVEEGRPLGWWLDGPTFADALAAAAADCGRVGSER